MGVGGGLSALLECARMPCCTISDLVRNFQCMCCGAMRYSANQPPPSLADAFQGMGEDTYAEK
eukprot:16039-Amphidinium_carterae.1